MPVEVFEASYLGMDTESAPELLAKGYCVEAVNVLTGQPGRLPIRGPLDAVSAQIWTRDITTRAWSSRSGDLVIGKVGSGTYYQYKTDGTLAAFTAATSVIPGGGGDFTMVGGTVGSVYGISQAGQLVQWDPTSPAGFVNYGTGAVAPVAGVALTYWQNRLWYLGGKLPGDTQVNSAQIGWSDPFVDFLDTTAAAWKDDISGLVNRIVFDNLGGANPGVGLGRLPSGLLVFGKYSGELLLGSSPANITVRSGAVTHGCIDNRSIVEYSGGVLWLAPEGFFYYDGAELVELSNAIRHVLRSAIKADPSASAVRIADDYVVLNVGGVISTPKTWLIHLPTKSWTSLTTTVMQNGGPLFLVPRGRDGLAAACDGSRLWPLDSLVNPENAIASLGQDRQTTGTLTPFAAKVTSRLAQMGEPSNLAQVQRVTVDAVSSGGWTIQLVDADGSVVKPSVALDTASIRKRNAVDVFAEAHELQLVAQHSAAANTAVPELRVATAEFTPAQPSGSY